MNKIIKTKVIIKIILILQPLLCFLTIVLAKTGDKKKDDQISINAILSQELKECKDSSAFIRILVSEHPYTSIHAAKLPTIQYIKKRLWHCDNINIQFQAEKPYSYMNIAVYIPGKIGNTPYTYYNVYVLERATKVKMLVGENKTHFIGKGAPKLNIQFDLFNQHNKDDAVEKQLIDNGKFQAAFEREDSLNKLLNLKKIDIVRSQSSVLGRDLTFILTAECLAQHFRSRFSNMRAILFSQGKSGRVDSLFEYYFKSYFRNIPDNLFGEIPQRFLLQTPIYSEYLYETAYMDTQIILNFRHGSYSSIDIGLLLDNEKKLALSNDIKKQLFLLTFLVFKDVRPEVNAIMDHDNSLWGQQSIYEQLYKKLRLQNSEGSDFYQFTLLDSARKTYRLKDFNDKLLIMDFWFTGCENCIVVKDAMKSIIDHFRNDPRVVFVTVSIDHSFEFWKKSLRSGLYTNAKELNLYTEDKGSEHPLIKYYRISTYPRIMAILKGKLYKSSIEAPSVDNSESIEKFITQIKAGLSIMNKYVF